MNITIAALQVIMVQRGVESGLTLSVIMLLLALFSAILLFFYFSNMQNIQTNLKELFFMRKEVKLNIVKTIHTAIWLFLMW